MLILEHQKYFWFQAIQMANNSYLKHFEGSQYNCSCGYNFRKELILLGNFHKKKLGYCSYDISNNGSNKRPSR